MSYILIIHEQTDHGHPGFDGTPGLHGPFETVVDAQAYAERWRVRNGLPGPATAKNNETWSDAGWYFGIVEPRRDSADTLPGGE